MGDGILARKLNAIKIATYWAKPLIDKGKPDLSN
jgi:hypothetical protein